MRKKIKQIGYVDHTNGKSVPLLRDFSLQAGMVKDALRRKRKNDVRNAARNNDVSIDSVNSNGAEHVLTGTGEGKVGSGYSVEIDPARNLDPEPSSTPQGGWTDETASAFFGIPGLRVAGQDNRAGLCEPDGVGRVEEPVIRRHGSDSSVGDQPE